MEIPNIKEIMQVSRGSNAFFWELHFQLRGVKKWKINLSIDLKLTRFSRNYISQPHGVEKNEKLIF